MSFSCPRFICKSSKKERICGMITHIMLVSLRTLIGIACNFIRRYVIVLWNCDVRQLNHGLLLRPPRI